MCKNIKLIKILVAYIVLTTNYSLLALEFPEKMEIESETLNFIGIDSPNPEKKLNPGLALPEPALFDSPASRPHAEKRAKIESESINAPTTNTPNQESQSLFNKENHQIHFSPENSPFQKLLEAIQATPRGGLIAMNGSFINHKSLLEELEKAENRGVRIEICVDARKKENKELLNKVQSGLHATNCLHTKRCIIFAVDPNNNLETALYCPAQLFTGSENLSNNAGNHHEYTFITKDAELIKRHYKDHLFNKALCVQYKEPVNESKEFQRDKIDPKAKKSVQVSPAFTRIYNSQKYDSGALKETRILKPVSEEFQESIYLSSMGFDDERIAKALLTKLRASSLVTLVVDKSAVKSKKGSRLLTDLHKAGAHIYVWLKSSLQHTKLLLRDWQHKMDPQSCSSLMVLSTGNLVKNSCTEINYDKIMPQSPLIAQTIREYFKRLIPLCDRFNTINLEMIPQNKIKQDKNCFSVTCGECKDKVGAASERTIIKKLLKHCIAKHEGRVVDSISEKEADSKTYYATHCHTCQEPFYSHISAQNTSNNLSKHLEKHHEMTQSMANETVLRHTISTNKIYIAPLETVAGY